MPDRPHKSAKKLALQRWKAEQRAGARARLPMPDAQMQAMFDMLDIELPIQGCDKSLRLVQEWLSANGLPVEPTLEWVRDNGGCCDCEVLANAEQAWQATRGDANQRQDRSPPLQPLEIQPMPLRNEKVKTHPWLSGMYDDEYFPDFLVDKIRVILLHLCDQIEREQPKDEESLLKLTHAATERINELEAEFEENDSELETVAREVMAGDFAFLVRAYGFAEVDIDDVIAPRDW